MADTEALADLIAERDRLRARPVHGGRMTRPERLAALVCVLCLLGAVLVGCIGLEGKQ